MGSKRWATLLAAGAVTLGAGGAKADTDGGDYAIHEHQLVPVDSYQMDPALRDGDITEKPREWTFPREHLAEGARWSDPFVGPELFPELSAGVGMVATHEFPNGQIHFGQEVNLNLYLLQIHVPFLTTTDAALGVDNRTNMDLLLPWKISDAHRLGLIMGIGMPVEGPSEGLVGYRYEAMYGFGTGVFDLQARVGYGYEPPGVTASGGSLLYGLQGGLAWADWGRVVVQADGVRTVLTRQDYLRVLPGFRFFPANDQTVQLGLAALIDIRDKSGGGLETRNLGGLVDASYNFL